VDESAPAWLKRLRDDLSGITSEAAAELWPSPEPGRPAFFNYRVEHVRQVERDARALLKEVGGDEDIVLAAVWVHDRFQPKFVVPNHGRKAAEWAAENLAGYGFPAGKVGSVCHAAAVHSEKPGAIPAEAHEARILWDADKLAHVGPHEILTLLLNNLATDRLRSMHDDPAFRDQAVTIEALARVRLKRFAKSESPAGKFYFPPSRQWAGERFEAQRAFYESLCAQIGVSK
jgi:hypothetical protein